MFDAVEINEIEFISFNSIQFIQLLTLHDANPQDYGISDHMQHKRIS